MRGISVERAALLGIASAFLMLASPALAAKRIALVIGNNDYRNVSKLQKAVNDARTMGDTLRQLGFSVMVAENQTRQAFSQTLLAFDQQIEAGDTAFFFYAGHGFEIAGQNYLLPTDVPAATEGQEELVRDASILADRIVERLQNRKARTSVLVFDACRNNPFERKGTRAVAGGAGLAPMTELPEGVFSVFSAGPRQTALDRLSDNDSNPNSVFTRIFAKELVQPGETMVQVAQRTRRTVSEMAETVRHKQVPVYFDQMVDDVFLNGPAKAEPPSAHAEPAQKVAALPVAPLKPPSNEAVNAPIASRATTAGGPSCSRSPIPRSGFPGAWVTAASSRKPAFSIRSIHEPESACQIPRSSLPPTRRPRQSRCAMSMPTAKCRDHFRSGSIRTPHWSAISGKSST
jgi:hypothetical protein